MPLGVYFKFRNTKFIIFSWAILFALQAATSSQINKHLTALTFFDYIFQILFTIFLWNSLIHLFFLFKKEKRFLLQKPKEELFGTKFFQNNHIHLFTSLFFSFSNGFIFFISFILARRSKKYLLLHFFFYYFLRALYLKRVRGGWIFHTYIFFFILLFYFFFFHYIFPIQGICVFFFYILLLLYIFFFFLAPR